MARCLTLARALREKGADSLFVHRAQPGHMGVRIRAEGFSVCELPSREEGAGSARGVDHPAPRAVAERDAEETAAAVDSWLPDCLVVDHYQLDAVFESESRLWAQRIVVLDDLANRQHDADLLLDQNYGRDAADYRLLVPRRCAILTGADYTLLRPEFARTRPAALARRDAGEPGIHRILVSLGASDPHNITRLVLDGVRNARIDAAVDVVLGSGAPHLDDVARLTDALPRARMLVDVGDMAGLMAAADVAIGTGGTTSWERCCLGLPCLALADADNQRIVLDGLSRADAIEYLGWFADIKPQHIAQSLRVLDGSPIRLRAMSLAARAVCDGQGTRRFIEYLLHESMHTTHVV